MESEFSKFIGFRLGAQWFALGISSVKEIVEPAGLIPIPKCPECAMGVFNYHGKVVTVVDPKNFFSIAGCEPTIDSRIIIFSDEDRSLGIFVDQADKIEKFAKEEIEVSKEAVGEKGFISVVVRSEDRLYNLIDPEPLIDAIEEEFSTANAR